MQKILNLWIRIKSAFMVLFKADAFLLIMHDDEVRKIDKVQKISGIKIEMLPGNFDEATHNSLYRQAANAALLKVSERNAKKC